MVNLIEIEKKYPNKIKPEGFLEIYDKYFKVYQDKEIKILEIGVDKGESLRVWREYFSKAIICGLDIDKKDFEIENVDIIVGDQSNLDILTKIVSKYGSFDIIIDDGSHRNEHVIKSLDYLFDYLNYNGFYIVEDLQTSYFPRYGGSRYNLLKGATSMNYIKSMTDSINYEQNNKPFYKRKKYDGIIKYIHFYQNLVVIKKGKSTKLYYKDSIKENSLIETFKKFVSYFYK
jgi:hypothetical protein